MTGALRRTSIRLAASTLVAALVAVAFAQSSRLHAQAPEPAKGVKYAQISQADMKDWLTYLASDELQGRQIFTEGYGLAASYVADHLKQWGVKPLGDDGTYFQTVKLKGYKVTRNSSITVTVNSQSKTFKHGDHVTFVPNSGGRQTLTFSGVEFVGYGAQGDYQGRNVRDKLVVWLPNRAPAPASTPAGGRGAGRGGGGNAAALNIGGAKAIISLTPAPAPPSAAEEALTRAQSALEQAQQAVAQAQQQVQGRTGRGGTAGARGAVAPGRGGAAGGRGGGAPTPDFTTVQRVDDPIPPQLNADETFYEFLFSASPTTFADLNAKAEKGEPLAPMTLSNVAATITIDNTFAVLTTQLSKNDVGMIEGSDPKLKDTYVMFGAHLDHIGYRQAGGARPENGNCRRTQESVAAAAAQGGRGAGGGRGAPAGRGGAPTAAAPPLPPLDQQDTIANGADDDGSGSTALLGIAKAFATGPKPKRSIVLVWHTGEESGLYGSRYNADFPVVPLDKVQAQLNIDMIGRDDCDDLNGDYTNSVFVVGADRISTDLHNLIVDTNAAKAKPLTLDYELNDANDPESIYTRSDHYSYALKGIPIAFFTTGLHKDYHQVSDSVEKILFPKMTRIAQLVYETGFNLANSDRVLERDNLGSRTGKGFEGRVVKEVVMGQTSTAVRSATTDRPVSLSKPRMSPLAETQWTDAHRNVIASFGHGRPPGNELATLLNHPELAASVMAVAKYFSEESELSPRLRTILILRTAWLCRSEYIWAHYATDASQVNLRAADLRRIAQGAGAQGWDRFEATLVGAADELYRNSSLSSATWNGLSSRFNQHQMMDAVFTVPAFTMLAMIDNSLGVQLEPGLTARLPRDVPYVAQVPAREAPLQAARIPPLDPPDWTPAIRTMLDPTGSGRNVIAVYRTFARHPKLYAPRQLLSEHIRLQNTLSPPVRELLILRMGWLGQSEYEWQQHARTGRTAGLDTERVAIGPEAAGWDAVDRALLRAADEIYRDDMVSDATWAALTPHFDTRQMLDVLTTAGGYRMVSTVLNTFGVQLEPGGERFPAVPRR